MSHFSALDLDRQNIARELRLIVASIEANPLNDIEHRVRLDRIATDLAGICPLCGGTGLVFSRATGEHAAICDCEAERPVAQWPPTRTELEAADRYYDAMEDLF